MKQKISARMGEALKTLRLGWSSVGGVALIALGLSAQAAIFDVDVSGYTLLHRSDPWKKTAVILYDTMWEATRRMAEAVGDGLAAEGVPYKIFHMAVTDRNDVITEIFKTKAVIVGSCTVNQGVRPTISPILEDLRGLRFQNKIGAAFGSYGWSGESVKVIEEHLQRCKIPVACPGVRAKWQPRPADLDACANLGREVAKAVKG